LNLLGAIVGFLINKSFKTKRLFNKQIWRKLYWICKLTQSEKFFEKVLFFSFWSGLRA
jgi:hypothetical protein